MTYDAKEIRQLTHEFRRARADARAAQDGVTQAYRLFLVDAGPGPSPEQLAHLQTAIGFEEAACRKCVARLEAISQALTVNAPE